MEDLIYPGAFVKKVVVAQRTLQWTSAKSRRITLHSMLCNFTLTDAIAGRKLPSPPVMKHFIPELNCNRVISTTLFGLRTRHVER
ncbi:hypothetical protein TNCV_4418421 [Trichonephila clavipes]|nr:hypothetical protein TNCV_4418421 [Trichonephila clavipes]